MLDTDLPLTIFDPDRVEKISIAEGTLYPWQVNPRACVCQKCRNPEVPAGSAVRFMKGRNGSITANGYFCVPCVIAKLKANDWHWNPIDAALYPKQHYTIRPIDGETLATRFHAFGERGLYNFLMERNRK